MSEILKIRNSFVAFNVDETSHYVYHKWKEKVKEEQELKNLVSKHSVKKKKV